MSLRLKMVLQIGAMIVGLVMVSTAALLGLNGLHQDLGLALAKYDELRHVYGDVGMHLKLAESRLPNRAEAASQVEMAIGKYDLYVPTRASPAQASSSAVGGDGAAADAQAEQAVRRSLAEALAELRAPAEGRDAHEVEVADGSAVREVFSRLGTLGSSINRTIQDRQAAGERKRRATMLAIGILGAVVVAAAIAIGVLQYRSVMLPLHRLGAGVRHIAAGQFQRRLNERGSREFATLANEFNRMAAELDEFYHRLEEKVAAKSRELIRSERLASVGYLAAGVAHEINNPLGIIAGYAEYSLSKLQGGPGAIDAEDLARSLQVIGDESFRCKDIIGKLLSLARPGEGTRQPVDLAKVAADVAATVGGLRDYRDRQLVVRAEPRGDLAVLAIEAEMKQVVLNLTLNALEAVAPGGTVRIDVTRQAGQVELRVSDNGRGMTPQTLERVFEPFFTEKRGARQPGTGLGLSISHAIVESHGGRLSAHSDGPGKGSAFVVELPAAAASSTTALSKPADGAGFSTARPAGVAGAT